MHAQHQLLHISECSFTEEARNHTKLQFPGPHCLGWIGDKSPRKVTLDAADHVMVFSFPALADDSKCVVFHDRGAANSAKEALLHPAVKTENGNFRRRLKIFCQLVSKKKPGGGTHNFDLNRDFSKSEPRDEDTRGYE
jgi:hypothetical protein